MEEWQSGFITGIFFLKQSQLDGVKDGLENMRSAVNELDQVKEGLEDVKTSYKSVDSLYTVLKVSLPWLRTTLFGVPRSWQMFQYVKKIL